MADFIIPNVVKLKLLFEIIGFFYFSFIHKKNRDKLKLRVLL